MLPYFPFTGEPYEPSMGLKPLDLRDWIEPDALQGEHLRLKADLLVRERDLVLRAPEETREACRELYRELARHLPRHHPDFYQLNDGFLRVLATDRTVPATPPPDASAETLLSSLSEWIQEDVCLLSPTPPVRITAGSVCFPSRWNLPEKFGLDPAAVHAPVPRFNATLGTPTRHFLERLTVEKPVWRLNWTLHDSDTLFSPHPVPGRTDLTPDNVLGAVHLRIERQTLRRLPETGTVVFTIRTHLTPLTEVIADPDRRRLLHATLVTLPAEVVAYKGMATFMASLLETLGAR